MSKYLQLCNDNNLKKLSLEDNVLQFNELKILLYAKYEEL